MNHKLSLIAAVAATLASACATPLPPPPVKVEPTPTELRLVAMGANVQTLLMQLNSLEQSRQAMAEPPKSVAEQLPADHALMRPVSLTWRGDARVVLERLAKQANLSFGTKGVSGTVPMVKVDVKGQPLAGVLENVGMQVGGVADLVFVEGPVPMIEMRYRGKGNDTAAEEATKTAAESKSGALE